MTITTNEAIFEKTFGVILHVGMEHYMRMKRIAGGTHCWYVHMPKGWVDPRGVPGVMQDAALELLYQRDIALDDV